MSIFNNIDIIENILKKFENKDKCSNLFQINKLFNNICNKTDYINDIKQYKKDYKNCKIIDKYILNYIDILLKKKYIFNIIIDKIIIEYDKEFMINHINKINKNCINIFSDILSDNEKKEKKIDIIIYNKQIKNIINNYKNIFLD